MMDGKGNIGEGWANRRTKLVQKDQAMGRLPIGLEPEKMGIMVTKIKHEAHELQRTNSQCAEHPCQARSLKQALYQIVGKRLGQDSWEGSKEVALGEANIHCGTPV